MKLKILCCLVAANVTNCHAADVQHIALKVQKREVQIGIGIDTSDGSLKYLVVPEDPALRSSLPYVNGDVLDVLEMDARGYAPEYLEGVLNPNRPGILPNDLLGDKTLSGRAVTAVTLMKRTGSETRYLMETLNSAIHTAKWAKALSNETHPPCDNAFGNDSGAFAVAKFIMELCGEWFVNMTLHLLLVSDSQHNVLTKQITHGITESYKCRNGGNNYNYVIERYCRLIGVACIMDSEADTVCQEPEINAADAEIQRRLVEGAINTYGRDVVLHTFHKVTTTAKAPKNTSVSNAVSEFTDKFLEFLQQSAK
jgi:hypothetical protein